MANAQPSIGHFAPFPPARTGVADYADELHRALLALCDIRKNDAGADIGLYHIGNNHLHRSIYERALARPGVVVLHDAVLIHFLLGWLARTAFVEEFVYNYGEWHRELGGALWDNRARSGSDPSYFARPMLRRIAESARAVVVHNPAAARAVREHAPQARVCEIPHLYEPPAAPPDPILVSQWRLSQGVEPATVLFGVFGFLRESKRLASVLKAFELVRSAGRDIALLVAGEFASRDLKMFLAPLLERPGILSAGYLEPSQFLLHAAAVDAAINLRYPPAGETSGIAIHLMGLGKPVILTAGEETSAFPEDACLRVDPGAGESDMLAHYLALLAEAPEYREHLGKAAARYILRNHAPERTARLFKSVLIDAVST